MLRRLFLWLALASFGLAGCSDGVSYLSDDKVLGVGRLFSNDYLGDHHDRWQTGSYALSIVTGQDHQDARAGHAQEYRLRTALISSDGRGPDPGDRPYAATFTLGQHQHIATGTNRTRLGVDITVLGPQTGLSDFQARVHDQFGLDQVRFVDQQLGDDVHVGVSGETADHIALGPNAVARPFAEVQLGPEDLMRAGVDVFIGRDPVTDLLIRDVTTGHLYRGLSDPAQSGLSYTIGADVARVADSVFLPGGGLAAPTATRHRARAGLAWDGPGGMHAFYGLTYLGPEFAGQDGGQITGSLTLNFNF